MFRQLYTEISVIINFCISKFWKFVDCEEGVIAQHDLHTYIYAYIICTRTFNPVLQYDRTLNLILQYGGW